MEAPLSRSCRPSNWALPVFGHLYKKLRMGQKGWFGFESRKSETHRGGSHKLLGQFDGYIKAGYFVKTCWCTPGWECMFIRKRKRGLVDSWRSLTPQTHFCQCSFFSEKSTFLHQHLHNQHLHNQHCCHLHHHHTHYHHQRQQQNLYWISTNLVKYVAVQIFAGALSAHLECFYLISYFATKWQPMTNNDDHPLSPTPSPLNLRMKKIQKI